MDQKYHTYEVHLHTVHNYFLLEFLEPTGQKILAPAVGFVLLAMGGRTDGKT